MTRGQRPAMGLRSFEPRGQDGELNHQGRSDNVDDAVGPRCPVNVLQGHFRWAGGFQDKLQGLILVFQSVGGLELMPLVMVKGLVLVQVNDDILKNL